MNLSAFKDQHIMFINIIDDIEKEYYLYFGLKTIQKQLDSTERIYDHFKIDRDIQLLTFNKDSDLPEEIRELVFKAFDQVFI